MKLYTIKAIFNEERIFRIPAYQRGYSWGTRQLMDFWLDLENLRSGRIHYMDVISVEKIGHGIYSQWESDRWIIEGGRSPYYIVDGQQRITTIIILMQVIIEALQDGQKIGTTDTKGKLLEKYIFLEDTELGEKSYILGYEVDDPSNNYLKKHIFNQEIGKDEVLIDTTYTDNLRRAKEFFKGKFKEEGLYTNPKKLRELYTKLTAGLKFDFNEIGDEFDIHVVFETKNNRGKPLSHLEKLKNRLIYLSTLLPDTEDKAGIKKNITDTWKDVYKFLGRNPGNKLDDDVFLMTHWIMYGNYDRTVSEFYAVELFEKKFTVSNTVAPKNEKNRVTGEAIKHYVDSLRKSVQQWFAMNNPLHPEGMRIIDDRETSIFLNKLQRLGFRSFAPIMLGAFVKDNIGKEKRLTLIKRIEQYIFLIFCVSHRRSNTGTYHFNAKASEFYNGQLSIDQITDDIQFWIHGNEYYGYYDIDGFYKSIKDNFQRDVNDNEKGYLGWKKWLHYFLLEYEEHLSGKVPSISWDKRNNHIELAENIKRNRDKFPEFFREGIGTKERKHLKYSLGNIVLTSEAVSKERQPMGFYERQTQYYGNGSAIEQSWAKESTITPEAILKRGLDMLNFFEKRWECEIGDRTYKKQLLFLDFLK